MALKWARVRTLSLEKRGTKRQMRPMKRVICNAFDEETFYSWVCKSVFVLIALSQVYRDAAWWMSLLEWIIDPAPESSDNKTLGSGTIAIPRELQVHLEMPNSNGALMRRYCWQISICINVQPLSFHPNESGIEMRSLVSSHLSSNIVQTFHFSLVRNSIKG
jgi:hypothetical protein